jgi:peptide deformylase
MKRKRVTAKLIIAPNPLLTTVCEPVEDGEDVSGIIRDMMYVLTNSKHGVGLAAPQAGHLKRIILVKENEYIYNVLINPEITNSLKRTACEYEGCLSYPGKAEKIERLTHIDVSYLDSGGNSQQDPYNYRIARIIQHEIDHLNGKCRVGESK